MLEVGKMKKEEIRGCRSVSMPLPAVLFQSGISLGPHLLLLAQKRPPSLSDWVSELYIIKNRHLLKIRISFTLPLCIVSLHCLSALSLRESC